MAKPYHTLDWASLDRLESLHNAYVGLQVLSGIADIDSHHVSAVLVFLNEALSRCVDDARPPSPSPGLRLVDD